MRLLHLSVDAALTKPSGLPQRRPYLMPGCARRWQRDYSDGGGRYSDDVAGGLQDSWTGETNVVSHVHGWSDSLEGPYTPQAEQERTHAQGVEAYECGPSGTQQRHFRICLS